MMGATENRPLKGAEEKASLLAAARKEGSREDPLRRKMPTAGV